MPRRRGNGWSMQGSKAFRRRMRDIRKNQWFYVVAIGWKSGVYKEWKNAKAQVHNYPNNLHKKFRILVEAQNWLQANRICPPGVRTILPPHVDTPNPPLEYNPEYAPEYIDYEGEIDAELLNVPPYVAVGPATVNPVCFVPVRQLAERIAADDSNLVLDPPSVGCTRRNCGFCTGDHMSQRFHLMQRLFQLNAQLPHIIATDGAGATRPGQFAG